MAVDRNAQAETIRAIRAILIAYGPQALQLGQLNQCYMEHEGNIIPSYGFSNVLSFMAFSGQFVIASDPGMPILITAIANTDTTHLVNMIAMQNDNDEVP